VRELLRRRDIRLLLVGQTLSMFGDWAMFFVLAIWAKVLTGSNAAAGLVFFVLALAGLAAPLGGLVVDRLPKRWLMIVTHLAMAAMVCLLLFVNDRTDLWLIYVVAALYGLGGDLFGAARSAMLKAMLPDELLAEANGILQSLREGLRLVAPLAGAGIFAAFGGAAVALVDAGSFALSAVTLVLLRFVEPAVAAHEPFLRDVSAGVLHIVRTRVLRELTIGVCAVMLVAGFSETIIFAVTSSGLHRPPSFIGVIATFQGVGAIAGGLTAPMLMRRLGDVRLAGLGVVLFGVGDGLWLFPRLPVVLVATAVARHRDRVGRRLAGDVVPAPQPDGGAGPRQRRREHAVQRAADDLDRDRRGADHRDRLPGADRRDGRGVRVRVRVSPHTPRGRDARRHACSFSRSSRLTTFGSALPCVSFITWPTRKPSTPSLPPR